ncbi:Corrinoid adenosyltransferase [Austwickia sp. TVS 96-490-7B]|uniref:cob(I)yrinic acid a,c-diamide adenosyltransferase n=1 Tax=Austwickia sp. TVS 96-490-7B TaxID=2830843 RepID=UPI001C573D15|nr:cob(I)yrinic acid a,c-diamide adenosyltransferase [Austwickia sp. TVS 96-490-7B]MBW3084570.1 Corrinoid adenosyltransferase [Austwickia sp. TVS 96-490-7B]
MVNITRVYTKTGDDGTTALGDFSRTRKTDVRLAAYADCNEANAALGIVLTTDGLDDQVRATLTRIQNDLFDVGADLCNPLATQYRYEPLRVREEWIAELEEDCDRFNEMTPALRSFILPGGSTASAYLHLACTIVRRAERSTWAAIEVYGTEPATPDSDRPGGINPATATYLNRLSDLLFVLARVANLGVGDDVLWQPGGGRAERPTGPRPS